MRNVIDAIKMDLAPFRVSLAVVLAYFVNYFPRKVSNITRGIVIGIETSKLTETRHKTRNEKYDMIF